MNRSDLPKKVELLDAKIDQARRERSRIEELPVPRTEAEARIDAQIEDLAGQWRISALEYATPDRVYEAPNLVGRVQLYGARQLVSLEPVAITLAALFPELIKQRLKATLAEAYQDGDGVGEPERRASIQAIDERIFEYEVERERLVDQAAAEGLYIPRRMDANPAAIIAASR